MKNCTCIADIEKGMVELVKPKAGDDATAKIDCTALCVTEDMELELVMMIPFRIKGSKKGFTSERGKDMGMRANYCPFCGKEANRLVPAGQYDALEVL